jgi:hypothetical protein
MPLATIQGEGAPWGTAVGNGRAQGHSVGSVPPPPQATTPAESVKSSKSSRTFELLEPVVSDGSCPPDEKNHETSPSKRRLSVGHTG